MKRLAAWLPAMMGFVLLGAGASAQTDMLVDATGEFTPDSAPREIHFDVQEVDGQLVLNASASLRQGTVAFRVYDPVGEMVCDFSGGTFVVSNQAIPVGGRRGTFRLEVVPQGAVGTWKARVSKPPELSVVWVGVVSGFGMILVALGTVAVWKRASAAEWRWLWVGAAVWAVGVALKIGWSVLLNGPVFAWLQERLVRWAFIGVGGLYIGGLTGVFEIGVTLVAVLVWRRLAQTPGRGTGVGVGAGSFEALLLGLVALVVAAVVLSGHPAAAPLIKQLESSRAGTSVVWLVGPVERVLAILCHTASRSLVLLGAARRRWSLFGWGFLLLTGLDAVVGCFHLAGLVGNCSTWWIELAIVPFALVSIPVIWWCVRRWPEPEPGPAPLAAREG